MNADFLKNFIKESLIFVARHFLGEARTHDYLIRRGIQVRQLQKYYKDSVSHCDLKKTSSANCNNKSQTLIFMVNGSWMHGGLTDRLRGMTSAWDFAQQHNLDFKIFHTSPFELSTILMPNKTDWCISENEISWDSQEAKPVLLYRADFENIHALERQLDSSHRQFHLYSCVDSVGDKFPKLFNELFTPSPLLQHEIDKYQSLTQEPFGAISFRMQNLLGDFAEGKFSQLKTSAEKQDLLKSALNALDKVIEANPQWNKILVTADSPTLLKAASIRTKVVTVSGKSIHIDFNSSKAEGDYIKAFVEFLLISKAEKSFLYRNRKYKTYPSNFPRYAAKLGNVPFEIIED